MHVVQHVISNVDAYRDCYQVVKYIHCPNATVYLCDRLLSLLIRVLIGELFVLAGRDGHQGATVSEPQTVGAN